MRFEIITAMLAGVGGDLPAHATGDRISDTVTVLREYEGPKLGD